jgi:hypothetical protein
VRPEDTTPLEPGGDDDGVPLFFPPPDETKATMIHPIKTMTTATQMRRRRWRRRASSIRAWAASTVSSGASGGVSRVEMVPL